MFNLEKYEKILIGFLVLMLLSGIGLSLYKKSHPGVDIRIGSYSPAAKEDIDDFPSYKMNINEASEGDLAKLKGVGKVLAGRIVEYRTSNGPFASIEGIKNVKGVGEALFEKIKDDITVE